MSILADLEYVYGLAPGQPSFVDEFIVTQMLEHANRLPDPIERIRASQHAAHAAQNTEDDAGDYAGTLERPDRFEPV